MNLLCKIFLPPSFGNYQKTKRIKLEKRIQASFGVKATISAKNDSYFYCIIGNYVKSKKSRFQTGRILIVVGQLYRPQLKKCDLMAE